MDRRVSPFVLAMPLDPPSAICELRANSAPVSSPENCAKSDATLTIQLSVHDAVATLLKEPRFLRLVRAFARDRTDSILTDTAQSLTEADFQRHLGVQLLAVLLSRTANGMSVVGLEHLENMPPCLYISNHRDIVLDSALLNSTLLNHNVPIPHVIIGDNLLQSTWLQPFFRLCKAVVVQRALRGKELFEHSLRLSEHVRQMIEGGESVWIAQRAGRTKDGLDRTEPALLRMLLLAYERNPPAPEQVLNVTPIAVSYELEPCDVFKAAASLGTVTKNASLDRARNDAANILRGLVQPKGRIQLAIRRPLQLDNSDAKGSNRADKLAELASRVDREIACGYAIWPTNYAAHDLLHNASEYASRYTADEKLSFSQYIDRRTREIVAPPVEARNALLSLYARPLIAQQAL